MIHMKPVTGACLPGRTVMAGVMALASAVFGYAQVPRTRSANSAASGSAVSQRAFLDRYCAGCHNEKLKTASLLVGQN